MRFKESLVTAPLFSFTTVLVVLLAYLYTVGALARNVTGLHYLLGAHWPFGAVSAEGWPAQTLDVHPRLRLWLAQDAYRAGDLFGAADLLRPLVMGESDAAIDARRLLGRLWEEEGRLEDAIAIWRESGDAHALVNAAQRAQLNEQYVLALRAYEAADQVDPSVGKSALVNFLWRTMREPDEAEAVLLAGIERQPDSSARRQWLAQLGGLYQDQQRWHDAVGVYHALHQLQPEAIDPLIQLGWSHYYGGDGLEAALLHFQRATSVAPADGAGYFAIGQLLAAEKNFGLADKWFGEAVARERSNVTWQAAYAQNARQDGQPQAAIARNAQALQTLPDAHQLYFQLAELYAELGDFERAKTPLMQALALAGDAAPMAYHRQLETIQAELGE